MSNITDFLSEYWKSLYQQMHSQFRKDLFLKFMQEKLLQLELSGKGKTLLLIGNGPSLQNVDWDPILNSPNLIKVGFNWIVNHPFYEKLELDHLILPSHMFFGGWHTSNPTFPESYLLKIKGSPKATKLWFPFYFKPLLDNIPELQNRDVNFMLLEKPYKEFSNQIGYIKHSLYGFLSDSHTGVLTFGVPLGIHLGVNKIILIGCDANYHPDPNKRYFYEKTSHQSLSTDEESLIKTWAPNGVGPYCYQLALSLLKSRYIELVNCSETQTLDFIPKGRIRDQLG